MPSQIKPTTNSLSSPANPGQGLVLNDINGKQVELTASHLEKGFAQAAVSLLGSKHELTPSNTASLSAQFLKHFDLQTGLTKPQDIINFLKSPGGKIITTLIGKQLAEMTSINEHVKRELLTEQLMKRRRLSFLLAGLLHRRKARAHRLNEETQLAIDKRHRSEESIAIEKRLAASSSTNNVLDFSLRINFTAYTKSSKEIERLLDNLLLESKTLEDSLADIERLIMLAAKKYAHYHNHLDLASQEIASWTLLPTLSLATVHEKIQQLTSEIHLDTNEINQLLEEGKDDEAHEKITISNARNLHIAMLLDMIAVIEGDKHLYTKDGIKTTNFHEAEFIISKQNVLVFQNGKYYLVGANKNPENLSIEDKMAGEIAYMRLRPEIMGVKPLVQHNQTLEQENHNKTKSRLLTRDDATQQQILFLANQLTQIQTDRTDIDRSLKSTTPTPSMKPPAPTPVATANPSAGKQNLSGSYSHMLMSMRPTKRAIDWLKENIEEPKLKAQVNKLTPGKPIPPQVLQQLLARRELGRMWLNPGKPDIAKTDLTPYAAPPQRITPLSMIPKPFRTT